MIVRQSSVPGVLALAALLLLTGCLPLLRSASTPVSSTGKEGSSAAPSTGVPVRRGGTIRSFVPALQHLDTSWEWSPAANQVAGQCYDTLLGLRANSATDLNIEPKAAERWEVSADGRTYTFHIRHGVRFPDLPPLRGRELNAFDVAWKIDYEQKLRRVNLDAIAPIVRYDTPDPHTIVMFLDRPLISFLHGWASESNQLYPHEIYERDGNFRFTCTGTGPFYLREYRDGERVVLQANPNYWRSGRDGKALPYAAGYVDLWLQDPQTQAAAFKTGDIDLWYGGQGVEARDVLDDLRQVRPNGVYLRTLSRCEGSVRFNLRGAPFDDRRARQAVAFAIDRKALIDLAWAGAGQPAGYFWPGLPNLPWTAAELDRRLPFDPGEARRLVDAGGWSGLPVTLLAPQAAPHGCDDPGAVRAVGGMLQRVGFQVQYDWYVGDTEGRGKEEAGEFNVGGNGCVAAGNRPRGADTFFLACASSSPSNVWGPQDAALDALIDEAHHSLSSQEGLRRYRAVRDYVADRVYSVPYGVPFVWFPQQSWLQLTKSPYASTSRPGMDDAWLDDGYPGTR